MRVFLLAHSLVCSAFIMTINAPTAENKGSSGRPADSYQNQGAVGHAMTYAIGSVIALVGGVILLPVYTRALTPAEYGLLETVLRFVNVCMVVAFLGLRQGYVRFFFDHKTDEWHKTLTSTTIIGVIAISTAIMFPLIAVGSIIARRFGVGFEELTPAASALLALWLAFEATYLLGLAFLQVGFKSRQFMFAQCARVVTLLGLNYSFLHFMGLGLKGALLGNLLASILSGGIAAMFFIKWTGIRMSTPTLKEMVSFGLPFIPTAVFAYVISNADRLSVIHFGMVASLGLLSLASKLGDMALSLFATPIENIWMPYAFAVRDEPDGPAKIGKLYTRYAAFSLLIVVLISLGAPLAIRILATSGYQDASQLVPIVAIGCLFTNLSCLSDIGILIAKKTKLKPYVFACTAIVAVILQLAFTPIAGVVGAVVATTLTTMVHYIVISTVAARYYRFTANPRDFLSMTLGAGAAFFAGKWVMALLPSIAGDILSILVGVIVYCLVVLQTRVVTVPEVLDALRQLLRKKREH